jgi:hypothetical protein
MKKRFIFFAKEFGFHYGLLVFGGGCVISTFETNTMHLYSGLFIAMGYILMASCRKNE